MKQIFMFITLILANQYCFAQITVNGIVTDAVNGDGLPGVNIMIKGTDKGTISNLDGEYEIEIPGGKNELSYSLVGMRTKIIEINNRKIINVQLEDGDQYVNAYRISNKKETSSNVNQINQEIVSSFKTKRITVFKTGQVLFEKEANVDVKNKEVFFETLPFNNGILDNRTYYGQSKTNTIMGSLHFEASGNNINATKVSNNNLKLVLEKNKGNQKIYLKYLQNGLMWVSDYIINLGENNQGHVTLNATLINDIEDIKDVEINFAVGYPYFPFSAISSPMTERMTVVDMLNSLKQQSNTSEYYDSQYSKNNAVIIGYGMAKRTSLGSEPVNEQANTGVEDLLFYSKDRISIKKNETVKYPLANFDINYQDLYKAELKPSNRVVSNNGVTMNNKQENVVWHSVKFENTSGASLTSGIATFYKYNGRKIQHLSQGLISHVSKNESFTCKMSVAPDIIVKDTDSEIRRGVKEGNNSITVQGNIKVVNLKRKAILININRVIYGKLIDSNIPWTKNAIPNLWAENNQINDVCWSIQLEPGMESDIEYTYEYIFD